MLIATLWQKNSIRDSNFNSMTTPISGLSSDGPIESAGKKVIRSGSVFTFGNQPVSISVFDLTYTFTFLHDDKPQRLEVAQNTGKAVTFNVFNFSSPLGTGLMDPVEVGKLGGNPLFLVFLVHSLDKTKSQLLHYTFFQ